MLTGSRMYSEEVVNNSLAGRFATILVCILLIFGGFSCSKNKNIEDIRVTVLPEKLNAELHFRGFVTDEKEELVSEIYNFSKAVTLRDTIDGKPVFGYMANGKKNYFYTDEDGTVWEKSVNDIGARIIVYGFAYREPLLISDWEILLKVDNGAGTEWEVAIDTTFDAITGKGKTQQIRYVKKGKAVFDGWSETFLPEPYQNVRALDAYWHDLQTYIINATTSDTLFSTIGTAHQYFLPDIGSVKYISNFIKTEKGQEPVELRGTWELMRKEIPE